MYITLRIATPASFTTRDYLQVIMSTIYFTIIYFFIVQAHICSFIYRNV